MSDLYFHFSFFDRMHDFDDNGKLDGHEIRVASEHSLEHMAGVPPHLKESEMESKAL